MNDPMKSAAADAAATAAAFGARANYAKGHEDGAADLAHIRAEGAKALEEATRALEEAQARVDASAARPDRNIKDIAHIERMATKIETLKSLLEEANARIVELESRPTLAPMTYVQTDDAMKQALTAAESRIAVEASRADVAEQMVVELRQGLEDALPHVEVSMLDGALEVAGCIQTALSLTEPVAGRWVSVDAIGVALVDGLRTERDAAIARATAWEADALRYAKARDEVGIQYAAAQDRLRLAMEAVEMLRPLAQRRTHTVDVYDRADDALRALDTVPGDALAPHPTRHLEALGIDTDNVKEKS